MTLKDTDALLRHLDDVVCRPCRQAGLDNCPACPADCAIWQIETAKPVEATFCGYKVQHLAAVATLLQQKRIMPETVGAFFNDLDGAVRIAMDEMIQHARDEMEKTLAGMKGAGKDETERR